MLPATQQFKLARRGLRWERWGLQTEPKLAWQQSGPASHCWTEWDLVQPGGRAADERRAAGAIRSRFWQTHGHRVVRLRDFAALTTHLIASSGSETGTKSQKNNASEDDVGIRLQRRQSLFRALHTSPLSQRLERLNWRRGKRKSHLQFPSRRKVTRLVILGSDAVVQPTVHRWRCSTDDVWVSSRRAEVSKDFSALTMITPAPWVTVARLRLKAERNCDRQMTTRRVMWM